MKDNNPNMLEIIKENQRLKMENQKLRERLSRNNRPPIHTKIKDIVEYWSHHQDECGLSIDWAEAMERCWRCGYQKRLYRCHIIPDSLGGEDKPSNLVLLCSRCHIDAPNVESKTFMWDWIRANGTPLYDTFWNIRAQKEYEFIYGTSFTQELKNRDILSSYDLQQFWNIKIGRSIHHFAHPWNNESTDAGLLKMRIDEYDRIHSSIKKKSLKIRTKEKEFENFIFQVCELSKKYHFNVWEGRSKNPFSVTVSQILDSEKQINISIKYCKDLKYRACFTDYWNPNHNRVSDYTIDFSSAFEVLTFLEDEMIKFTQKYGLSNHQDYVFTVNPIFQK